MAQKSRQTKVKIALLGCNGVGKTGKNGSRQMMFAKTVKHRLLRKPIRL